MLKAAGCDFVQGFEREPVPGEVIHEMGTARMGRDPKTSFLNAFNQCHESPNVFVTDGSCMPSTACRTRRSPIWRSRRGLAPTLSPS
jgi:choline dehydrogenase-like flavoprotein